MAKRGRGGQRGEGNGWGRGGEGLGEGIEEGWRVEEDGQGEVSEGRGGEREGRPCDDVMPCCVGGWWHNDAG